MLFIIVSNSLTDMLKWTWWLWLAKELRIIYMRAAELVWSTDNILGGFSKNGRYAILIVYRSGLHMMVHIGIVI